MKNTIVIGLVFTILNICYSCQASTSSSREKEIKKTPMGFVFIDISQINNQNGNVSILNMDKDTVLNLQNQIISINGSDY